MADSQDDDKDEEWFKEVYGREYTGPPRPPHDNIRDDASKVKKRPGANATVSTADGSDEEDEPRDPNAVPTDFTSREAKVWEAKAKAVERNWKRRKEEELTCRLCGEVGHFAQGCPTTLGGNRKTGEIVERVSLRDKRLKPRIIGTGGAVIQGIEKDTGCRLKLEDNASAGSGAFFVRISGPDRLAVRKAVDVVNKLVEQVEDEWKQQQQQQPPPPVRRPHGGGVTGGGGNSGGGGSSGGSYRGSNVNPLIAAQMQHIAVQRLHHSAPNMGSLSGRGESPAPPIDEDKRTIEHIASQLEARRQWEAVSGSSQSLNGSGSSPPFPYKEGRGASGAGNNSSSYSGKGSTTPEGGSFYHGQNQDSGPFQSGAGNTKDHELEMELGFDEKPLAQSLEELEQRFLQETVDLTKDQNAEEDKENAKHRERMKDIQELYQQKMTQLRSKHARQREDFLRHDAQVRQQQFQQQAGTYGMYQYGSGGGMSVASRAYNGGYDRGANSASPENIPGHMVGFDGYKDGLQSYNSNSIHSFNRKQGYETAKNYGGSQGYDSAGYSYGGSQSYPTYG